MPVGILQVGKYLPETVIDNSVIARWSDTSLEWIERKTGIIQRRYAGKESTSDLGAKATKNLLTKVEEIDTEDINFLLISTSTQDQPIPATAALVANKVGLENCVTMDINAVCSGFIYGLVFSASFYDSQCEPFQYGLLVSSDRYSTIMDRMDKKTVSLFGDGAGAVLLGQVPKGYGILSSSISAKNSLNMMVQQRKAELPFQMQGRAVMEYALIAISDSIAISCKKASISLNDIDMFIFHQGNVRMLESIATFMGIPKEKLEISADRYGNTASASIPITLAETLERNKIIPGQIILLASVGGGMNVASMIVRWY